MLRKVRCLIALESAPIKINGITRDDGRVYFVLGIKKHLNGVEKSGVANGI